MIVLENRCAYDERTIKELRKIEDSKSGVYLFLGPRGLGKAHAAESIAKIVLSTERLKAHPDYMYIAPQKEKGKIGIDDLQPVFEFAASYPATADTRVIVVDDADSLTDSAQNALLKLLEDQTKYLMVILVAHRHLLSTVESRSWLILFYRATNEQMKEQLGERYDPVTAQLSGGRIGFYESMCQAEGYIDTVKESMNYLEEGKKAELFECLHLMKEKDKGSFYEVYPEPLVLAYVSFLRQIFYQILLTLSGIDPGATVGCDLQRTSEHYSILSLQASVSVLAKAEHMLANGQFNKNDWFDLLRFISG